MTENAFIVEGEMESEFVKNICPTSFVYKLNCNGDHVKYPAIATRISVLIKGKRLFNRCERIIIILDRERREDSCNIMESGIKTALLTCHQIASDKLIFGIPDREIESWILADNNIFTESTIPEQDRKDGSSGKTIIKNILKNKGGYSEVADGVKMLKRVNLSNAMKNSSSLKEFILKLSNVQCWYIKNQ